MMRRSVDRTRTRFLLLVAVALHSTGCVIYCSAYATSGCLTTEELAELGDQGKTADLVDYLHDDRSWVREAAAKSLGRVRAGEARPELEAMLLNREERSYVRAAAAEALGAIHDPAAIAALSGIAAAPGTPSEVKIGVISGLCAFVDAGSEPVQALTPLADDEDLLVSAYAEQSLVTQCGTKKKR